MAAATKPASKKQMTGRLPLTLRLTAEVLRNVEREAAKRHTISRTLLRELIEDKFSGAPKLSL